MWFVSGIQGGDFVFVCFLDGLCCCVFWVVFGKFNFVCWKQIGVGDYAKFLVIGWLTVIIDW